MKKLPVVADDTTDLCESQAAGKFRDGFMAGMMEASDCIETDESCAKCYNNWMTVKHRYRDGDKTGAERWHDENPAHHVPPASLGDYVSRAELDESGKRIAELEARLAGIRAVVDKQAEDDGLWADAESIVEAYLQQGLRRLHAVIEDG